MAEETYGLQVSLKRGDDMLNIRGADADEIVTIIEDLQNHESPVAEWITSTFGVGEDAPKPKRTTSSRSSGGAKKTSSGGGGMKDPDGDPSEKQINFAKTLKIRGYSKMSKAELSEAIDEALAARDEDDDDD